MLSQDTVNCFLADLKNDPILNEKAANASGLPYGELFGMEDFTYSNNIVAETMFRHLEDTAFTGVSVSYCVHVCAHYA